MILSQYLTLKEGIGVIYKSDMPSVYRPDTLLGVLPENVLSNIQYGATVTI